MKLAKDAKIFAAGQEEIGQLNRFVLDPKTHEITHIIFGSGGLLSQKEYVLPIEWVDQTTEEGIMLKALPMELDDLPFFEEDKYVIADERALSDNVHISANPGLRMYYHYPPASYMPFGGPTGGVSRSVDTGSQGIRRETEENIPDNTVALKEGTKVWSQDAKHVGDIEKIFMDPHNNKATHLLITKGLLNKEHKLVPVDWVENIYEDRVNLVLREELIDNLPEYHEKED